MAKRDLAKTLRQLQKLLDRKMVNDPDGKFMTLEGDGPINVFMAVGSAQALVDNALIELGERA